jgi:predicted cobalt transporter CbtA
MHNYESNKMNRNITMSLGVLALLLTGLFVSACSSNTVQEGVHFMGSAPMSGFHLKPAADGDRDNFGHGYVSGSGDPT